MATRVSWGRRLTIGIPFVWLLCFFLAPFLIVLKISFSFSAIAQPPYTPVWDSWAAVIDHLTNLSFENYTFLMSDPLYFNSYLNSLVTAGIATFLNLLISYPIAYGIARSSTKWRVILLTLVILPFWTSLLIRVYSWVGILKTEGLLNAFLLWTGVISDPLIIQYTPVAVYIGLVYTYLPFMILPLYATLEKLDPTLLEAAEDMGARPLTSFWRITLPLSLPGIAAGCFLVFIPSVGEFVIPELLGGNSTLMIGRTLWGEFFQNRDWPIASAVAVLLLMLLVIPIMLFQRLVNRQGGV